MAKESETTITEIISIAPDKYFSHIARKFLARTATQQQLNTARLRFRSYKQKQMEQKNKP